MKFRKMAVLSLAVLMMSTAAACGSSNTPASTEAAAETTEAVETTAAETEAVTEAASESEESTAVNDSSYELLTQDHLMTIKLPNKNWYQIITDEHTEMFSDGDCAIQVNLYKITDDIPSVKMNDDNHSLVYTASVSAGDYIMQVIGYAHDQSDFSGIGTAINSIVVDKTAITKDMLMSEQKTANYTIRDEKYSAWVTAEDLNVRSGSSKEASIIGSLTQNTKIQVTGTVLKDGADFGWVRVKLDSGKEGYVSSKFLTTKEPKKENEVTKTGYSIELFYEDATSVIVYEYTDGTWKDKKGLKYWKHSSHAWECENGYILELEPSTASALERTGASLTLYTEYGDVFDIFEYNNGTWQDEEGYEYEELNPGQWENTSNGNLGYVNGPEPMNEEEMATANAG